MQPESKNKDGLLRRLIINRFDAFWDGDMSGFFTMPWLICVGACIVLTIADCIQYSELITYEHSIELYFIGFIILIKIIRRSMRKKKK